MNSLFSTFSNFRSFLKCLYWQSWQFSSIIPCLNQNSLNTGVTKRKVERRRGRYRKRDRWREIFHQWFTPLLVPKTSTRPGQSQDRGTSYTSPNCCQGFKLGASVIVFLKQLSANWSQLEQEKQKSVPIMGC